MNLTQVFELLCVEIDHFKMQLYGRCSYYSLTSISSVLDFRKLRYVGGQYNQG